ncbi:glycoside hydrolase family 27 protein [Alteriqipengyuania sp.]|uniref:glycoside hydrolase family 27 protein n=1 Tax=Alteriqipengyuania sp. TaxID=2800692 RepID=UPI0035181DBA
MASAIVLGSLSATPGAAQKIEGLAPTPPMGWNSWNHYGCNIDETLIRETADALVSSGLRDAGYVNVNLDDCWHGERDGNGNIQPDPERFPSGMKALGDYLHARGLKFGIYSDAGTQTCAGRPGSQGYEFQDARRYAEWGVDYIKYDWCNTGKGDEQRNPREAYRTMSRAIAASGRPMVLSVCEWGDNEPWLWAGQYGHLWRTTGDIINCWDCTVGHGSWSSSGILPILDQQDKLRSFGGPDKWNDPDMMEVGNLPTLAENRSHFAMWAMLAAPLIIGSDVPGMTPEITAILANKRLIAINQDPLGRGAMKWIATPDWEIWAKPLADGEWAIALLNRGDEAQSISIDWAAVELKDDTFGHRAEFAQRSYTLTDAWSGKAAGDTQTALTRKVGPRDTAVFRLRPI